MLRSPTKRPAEAPPQRTRVESHTYRVPTVREIPRPHDVEAVCGPGW